MMAFIDGQNSTLWYRSRWQSQLRLSVDMVHAAPETGLNGNSGRWQLLRRGRNCSMCTCMVYCKFGNFLEGFILAKLHICEVS